MLVGAPRVGPIPQGDVVGLGGDDASAADAAEAGRRRGARQVGLREVVQ